MDLIVEDKGDLAEGLPLQDAAVFGSSRLDLAMKRFGWGVDGATQRLVDRVIAAILTG
ncbi:hypothetical protein OG613_45450 (plasmid) [Streptomyces sp. NBC_00015]|uniref:hypothetical protein n=1 Tax=unclassified Streptomyces TaxID=2593676 RepID=UPI002F90A8CF